MPTPLRPAGTTIGSFLGAERDDRLIRLDDAVQRLAIRIDHGPAQLGAQHPGGSVRAEAELALQLQSRDAVGVRGHQNAAQNQVVSGSLLACMIVPAVTEV